MTRSDAIAAVRAAASEACAEGQLPAFLAELEKVRSEAILSAVVRRPSPVPVQKSPGRVLTVEEASKRLGRSASWIYRHKAILPVTRFPTGGFGFDESALERWIEGRTSIARAGR